MSPAEGLWLLGCLACIIIGLPLLMVGVLYRAGRQFLLGLGVTALACALMFSWVNHMDSAHPTATEVTYR